MSKSPILFIESDVSPLVKFCSQIHGGFIVSKGSLLVVSTGIRVGHMTQETISALQHADAVAYCIGDSVTCALIQKIRKDLGKSEPEDLSLFYGEGKPRQQSYDQMVARMMELVREGNQVAAAFYGHAGVFAYPSHQAIREARAEGYSAEMWPGVSALDCLFADLGVDPVIGCQEMEATAFLLRKLKPEPACAVVLWQVGVVGANDYRPNGYDLRPLGFLVEKLLKFYPVDHEVVVYQAAHLTMKLPIMQKMRLEALETAKVSAISTLYIPPLYQSEIDTEVAERLKFSMST
jgi:uncharacterized protein YabN with tetrapyrrole methylase and pyrophosphatase domain